MKKILTLLLFVALYYPYVSIAQDLGVNLSIDYKSNVRNYWNIYNRDVLSNNFSAPAESLEKAFLEMFSNMEPYAEHLVNLAWVYHSAKKYPKAVSTYEKAMAKGYLLSCSETQPSFMIDNPLVPEYRSFLDRIKSRKYQISCTIDMPFCNLVIALFEIDQQTRLASYFSKKGGTDSNFNRRLYYTYYDSSNLNRLLHQIRETGIPHENHMTYEAQQAFMLLVHHLVQHTDWEGSRQLFQLVKAAIADGRLKNKFLKAAIDYMYWRYDAQYFGTVTQRNAFGKWELKPRLLQPESVDIRRAEWAFEPLYVQLRNGHDTNFVYPEGYLKETHR